MNWKSKKPKLLNKIVFHVLINEHGYSEEEAEKAFELFYSGKGTLETEFATCIKCDGTGIQFETRCFGEHRITCIKCSGTGKMYRYKVTNKNTGVKYQKFI